MTGEKKLEKAKFQGMTDIRKADGTFPKTIRVWDKRLRLRLSTEFYANYGSEKFNVNFNDAVLKGFVFTASVAGGFLEGRGRTFDEAQDDFLQGYRELSELLGYEVTG